MQTIALDLANRSTKIKSAERMDNYVNRFQRLYGHEISIGGMNSEVYEYQGEKYYHSPDGTVTSGGRNNDRYSTSEYLRENLFALGKIASQEDLDVVVGMPCEDYKDKTKLSKLKDNLIGNHTIKINDKSKNINIVKATVLPQPLGTLVDVIFDEVKSINDLKRVSKKYLIVDIGQGTTDIIASKGMQVEKVIGFNKGCMDVTNLFLDLANKKVENETGYKFTVADITGHLEPEIKKYDKTFDLTEELHIAKKAIMGEIRTFIANSGIDFADYDVVVFTGGGSLALKQYLPLAKNCFIHRNAQTSNVTGYYKYAMYNKGMLV